MLTARKVVARPEGFTVVVEAGRIVAAPEGWAVMWVLLKWDVSGQGMFFGVRPGRMLGILADHTTGLGDVVEASVLECEDSRECLWRVARLQKKQWGG